MKVEDLIADISRLSAMSDEELKKFFEPYFPLCRPQANITKAKSTSIKSSTTAMHKLIKLTEKQKEKERQAKIDQTKQMLAQYGLNIDI